MGFGREEYLRNYINRQKELLEENPKRLIEIVGLVVTDVKEVRKSFDEREYTIDEKVTFAPFGGNFREESYTLFIKKKEK